MGDRCSCAGREGRKRRIPNGGRSQWIFLVIGVEWLFWKFSMVNTTNLRKFGVYRSNSTEILRNHVCILRKISIYASVEQNLERRIRSSLYWRLSLIMKYWQITATKLAKIFQLNQTGPNSEKNSWLTDVSQSQTPPHKQGRTRMASAIRTRISSCPEV